VCTYRGQEHERIAHPYIVDDHEAVRQGVRAQLSSSNDWTVCGEAGDGIEAVEKAKSLRPDVVLMDISMPRMNGLDATRIIRKDLPDSKVVIISQNDPAIARRQAEDVEAAAYVDQSDLAHQLLSMVSKFLNGASRKKHWRNSPLHRPPIGSPAVEPWAN
jgi:DNA-binding NarL/FixJ family response regulator